MKSRWLFAILAVLWLVLISSLSVPVAAATMTVDLVLGAPGYALDDRQHCSRQQWNKYGYLSNTGYEDGVVTIWISGIVNSEGANPESETGDTAEPGELSDYLILNVSGLIFLPILPCRRK